MNQLLNLRINNLANKISKEKSLIEIVELFEKCGIEVVGNITNTSKKSILIKSLKGANTAALDKLMITTNASPLVKKNQTIRPIELHENFKGSKVEKFLDSGDFEEAVRVAFIRINNRVKHLSGLTSVDGSHLMRSAFSKNSPKLKINPLKTQEELDQQEGFMHIFEGSILAFRNPHSHDDEKKLTFQEAFGPLALANYLMAILDRVDVQK